MPAWTASSRRTTCSFPPCSTGRRPTRLRTCPGPLYGTTNNLNYNLGLNLVHNWFPEGDYSALTSAGFQYESRELNTVHVVGRNQFGGQNSLGAAAQISVGQLAQAVHDRGGYLQEDL